MDSLKSDITTCTTKEDLKKLEHKLNMMMQLKFTKYDLEKLSQLYAIKYEELSTNTSVQVSDIVIASDKPQLGSSYTVDDSLNSIKCDKLYSPYTVTMLQDLTSLKSKSLVFENLIDSTIVLPLPLLTTEVKNNVNSVEQSVGSIGRVQLINLVNCTITIHNPIKSDLYVLNCTNCIISGICHQFRISNSSNLKCKVYCESDPIQESSHGIEINSLALPENDISLFLLKRYKLGLNKQDLALVDYNHL